MNLSAVSAEYLIDLYDRFRRDPKSVDGSWRPYFDELWGRAPMIGGNSNAAVEAGFARLIDAFRQRGHLAAKLDPLGIWRQPYPPELDPSYHGISGELLEQEVSVPHAFALSPATTRNLVTRLTEIYASSVGFDCAHVDDPAARNWLYAAAESGLGTPDPDMRRRAAKDIIHAHEFEQFLGRRFLGKKRFGADGAEALIAWFEAVLAKCAENGVRDIVIGGTARGRLNVMANVLKKPLTALLHEFKGRRPFPDAVKASGDVPYHFGYETERSFGDTNVKLRYCHNPSHLEAIDGVALGRVRARQDRYTDREEGIRRVAGLLVHTDAAFAGQGVVCEVLQLSQVPAYKTGGTIHVVINNQVGFTTDPRNGRSSIYCTDVARAIGAPVLHVNADDADAVVRVARIAADYRFRFHADIVVDLVCYRRFGHNELDEPTFTQPVMYRKIVTHPSVRDLYVARIAADGVMSQEEADDVAADYFAQLDSAYAAMDSYRPNHALTGGDSRRSRSTPGRNLTPDRGDETGVSLDSLRAIGRSLSVPPNGMSVSEKIAKQLRERGDAICGGAGIAWAVGEALALASLACEGFDVRFSGQDTPRGAFSQRHFVLVDNETGNSFEPFNLIQEQQGRCQIVGTPLSEYSVLGFEYGYSMDAAQCLVVWEAQFGDFANVAQVIFDQFISSGEDKWLDTSGLTVMLPHGLEGQGPDHSSARIERFLQMCANDNMTVANCSTPANLFHLLRRQANKPRRSPLIVFTTKSLLRNRSAVSSLGDFGPGTSFQAVIGANTDRPQGVRRVVLCSGKIYYDLEAQLLESRTADVALVRLEQLYPFPEDAVQHELSRFPGASVIWCQEEPENMGAWSYIDRKVERILRRIGNHCKWPHCISRPENASTAIGTNDEHSADQTRLAERGIGLVEVLREGTRDATQ